MGYREAYGYVNCWKCGKHSLPETLVALADISVAQAKRLASGIKVFGRRDLGDRSKGTLTLPSGLEKLSRRHKEYLRSRDFKPKQLIKLWKIQGIRHHPKLSWRIFIPCHFHAEIVTWTARSIRPDHPLRYMSAPAEHEGRRRNEILYGEDYIRHTIIICEGATDVWRIGPGAVATLGLSYSATQLERMAQYNSRIVCFDSSSDAQRRANKLANDLMTLPGETYNVQLDAEDPGSASKKEINQLRKAFLD